MNNILHHSIETPDDRIAKIKKEMSQTFPSENGLMIPEIMVLYYASSFRTDSSSFQSFWLYKYGVDNVRGIIDSLEKRDFIIAGNSIDGLNVCSIAELRTIIEKYKLKKSRKRANMISEILENVSTNELDSIIHSRPYALTERGAKELNENQYIPYFHNTACNFTPQINVCWLNREFHTHPEFKLHWRDRIWGQLNAETIEAMDETKKGNCAFYIFNRETMAKFLIEEKKYADSLTLLTEAVYWQVNLRSPIQYLSALKLQGTYQHKEPDTKHITFLFPNIFSQIQHGMGLSNEEFAIMIRESFKTQRFSIEIFPMNLISAWILAEIMQNQKQIEFLREKYISSIIDHRGDFNV